jgi:hypothetical protein
MNIFMNIYIYEYDSSIRNFIVNMNLYYLYL